MKAITNKSFYIGRFIQIFFAQRFNLIIFLTIRHPFFLQEIAEGNTEGEVSRERNLVLGLKT